MSLSPGLCGWLGDLPAGQTPEPLLSALAAPMARGRAPSHAFAAPDLGLHLTPGSTRGGFLADDDLVVALEGYPRWAKGDLADLAATKGQGAALAQAYRIHGERLVRFLHGAFALAVLDRKAKRAVLAIDRMGTHSLAYGQAPDGTLVFGSSTASLAAHPGLGNQVSPQGLFNYLLFFYLPGPGTIYQAQRKLLPAQVVVYEAGRLATEFYWQIPFRAEVRGQRPALEQRLFEALRESVGHAIDGESPADTGAFLSGGLDSSSVTGLYRELAGEPVKVFTIGFDCDAYDETGYAATAAGHFDCEHHVYRVTPADVIDLIPRIGAAFDEPYGNTSVVPTYYCARLARDCGVDLLLAGDGGDELFAGNPWYPKQQLYERYQVVPGALRRGLIEPLVFGLPKGERYALVRKLRSYITTANQPMPDRGFRPEAALVSDIAEILDPDLFAQVDLDEPLEVLRRVYFRTSSDSLVHRMLHQDLETILAGSDLRKVTRMCALAGTRVRFPMLDEALVEMSTEVPSNLMIRGFKLRDFYRQAMRDFLPPSILSKRKHGFGLPWSVWLSQSEKLRDLVYDVLAMAKRRAVVQPGYVDRIIEQQRQSDLAPYAGPLWDLMILELWMQAHLDRPS